MTPRELIAQAWAITTTQKVLWRWGFASAFVETLLNAKLIGYQIYFAYAAATGKEVGMADDFIWLYHHIPLGWFIAIVVGFVILLAIEFILPHLCEGAIIGLAAKAHRGEPLRGGLVLALHNFLYLLAVHEIFVLSSWAMATSAVSLTLRYIDGSVKYGMIIGILSIFCISNLLKLCAGFAEEAIVLRKKGFGAGIAQSYKLLISHLSHIMFLLVLLFVISLRILINALTILVIPAVIIGLSFVLALFLSPFFTYLIVGVVGVGLIVVASYFFAYLHVFKQTVWTLTYMQLSEHRELDVIYNEDAEEAESVEGNTNLAH